MSFPRYPDYKDSGVEWLGDVPEHWCAGRFSRTILAIKDGTHGTFERVSAGRPLLSAKNVQDGYVLVAEDESMVSESDHLSITSNGFPQRGDLLLTIVGTIGRSCVYEFEGSFAFQRSVCFIRLLPGNETKFFYYFTQSKFFQEQLVSRSKSAAQGGVYMGDVVATSIVFPPLPEQTQIAAFLDRETAKIDGLVTEQRRLMALLKEKRQAVISHAVTQGLNPDAPMKPSGNKWLGDVPAHWVVSRLKHIKAEVKNAFVDGPFGSNLKSEHFIDDGDVYVIESNFATQGRIDTETSKTISNEHFATINRSETRGGDIIIAKIGAQYGKASILPVLDKPAVVSGNSLKLTINQKSCDVKFVNWHLANLKELGVMEDIVNATAQPALSLGEMNNLPMLVPPRAEQEAIVWFLDEKLGEFDTLSAEVQRAIDLLAERRTALISASVTGQIDVREFA